MKDLPQSEALDPRRSRVERVVEILNDWIVHGELDAGERLPPESRLAEHFAVSRTVIREAVRLLAERGLIEVAHGKRHRVRPPSPEVAASHLHRIVERGGVTRQELMELRWPLESAIALVAARRRTEEHVETMRQCLAEPATTIEEQVQQDLRFHQLLARATNNAMFEMVLEVFALPLAESRRHSMEYHGHARAVEQHQAILDAVAAGEDVRAEKLMKQHLDSAMEAWNRGKSEGQSEQNS
ncbi:MAG: FadR/GntR family transcriptional regulator [bacterium]